MRLALRFASIPLHAGAALLKAGIHADAIQRWTLDPQVPVQEHNGKWELDSLFDALEDLDAEACINRCKELQLAELAYTRTIPPAAAVDVSAGAVDTPAAATPAK